MSHGSELFRTAIIEQLGGPAETLNDERILQGGQGAVVTIMSREGRPAAALNLCANNYLGLATDPRVNDAFVEAARTWGAGLASVRFICGTQEIHKRLEDSIASFTGHEDAILFGSSFAANGGLFEALFGPEDAIISDSLNHASIIDGIRLSKARCYRFRSSDMDELEQRLREARSRGSRHLVIATDGVFSMDGNVANLADITRLADKYDALVMVDDCHATGHVGAGGRGSAAVHGVEGRIDILTGTFGKTLGGTLGGFACASREIIALLRRRARPYLFSNSLAPPICGAALEALQIAGSAEGDTLRNKLKQNDTLFRQLMTRFEFDLGKSTTPIIPVMIGNERTARKIADELLNLGILVVPLSFPVVPSGQARLRLQLSASHTTAQIIQAAGALAIARERVQGFDNA